MKYTWPPYAASAVHLRRHFSVFFETAFFLIYIYIYWYTGVFVVGFNSQFCNNKKS